MTNATHVYLSHQILEDMGARWKRGGRQHKVLHVLVNSQMGETAPTIRQRAGLAAGSSSNARHTLNELRLLGLVIATPGSDLWKASKKGLDVAMEIGAPPDVSVAKPKTSKQKMAELYQRPTYDGAELGQTCLRPGAYDAYSLPSIINGREVAPTWRNV